METQFDRWDLSYLYPDFDDALFKADLASLQEIAKDFTSLLQDSSLTRLARLEQAVALYEQIGEKLDRLNNFIQCTLAVDATNEKANTAYDQLMVAYTDIQLASSALARFVAETEDLEQLLASSDVLRPVSFALREMKLFAVSCREARSALNCASSKSG